jgi:alkanesulfonate monooxygenase SsuD/methylene tetrahydromethanopterin reductase-like flavin-dependent oxidoreductase (luciferase family)
MTTVQFGVFVAPTSQDPGRIRENVQTADETGFDYVSIQDHPYVPTFLDTFALIGSLIGQTRRVRFMPNVANLPLRPPAMLAKTAATLDVMSDGRFELGLGGGRVWSEITGLGGPSLTAGQVVTAVDEAITILRALWGPGGSISFTGQQYQLQDVQTGPSPAHPIGIWLGAAGPRMLGLLGHAADGWIAPLSTPFETKPAAQQRIDAAARAAGRRPDEIRRVIQLVGTVTDHVMTSARPRTGPGSTPIRTTPEAWAQIIAELVTDERFDTVNFIPETEDARQITRFATEVVPATRDILASTPRQG